VLLLILSAGIGNMISGFLDVRNLLAADVTVMANQLIFEDNERVSGFREPVIHSFNKRVEQHMIGKRKNVLLLGDTLEDARMVDDVDVNGVIRVGFLNDGVEENRDIYLDHYDLVVCRDGPMDCVVDLLDKI